MNAALILRFIDRRLSKWVVMNSEKAITTLSVVIAKAYLNSTDRELSKNHQRQCILIKGFAAKFGFGELCEVQYLAQHTNLHGNEV